METEKTICSHQENSANKPLMTFAVEHPVRYLKYDTLVKECKNALEELDTNPGPIQAFFLIKHYLPWSKDELEAILKDKQAGFYEKFTDSHILMEFEQSLEKSVVALEKKAVEFDVESYEAKLNAQAKSYKISKHPILKKFLSSGKELESEVN